MTKQQCIIDYRRTVASNEPGVTPIKLDDELYAVFRIQGDDLLYHGKSRSSSRLPGGEVLFDLEQVPLSDQDIGEITRRVSQSQQP